MQQEIINAVEGSIEALADLFKKEPTRFFTENDLVCCFHRFLYNSLEVLGVGTVRDRDGLPHSLIHCEYATAFRCDMKNKGFQLKLDTDVTTTNGKFRRGHYDVVVLNPTFIKSHSFASIKGQTYAIMKASVLPTLTETEPAFLFGVEFVFRRDPIKPSRKGGWEAAARRFVAEVVQDRDKLEKTVEFKNVMKQARMLAFLKGTTDKVLDFIVCSLQSEKLVTLVTAG